MAEQNEQIQSWLQGRTRFSRAKDAGDYIPTWSVGQNLADPNDLHRFAEDGYSKNSLIYSCIKEKATSFAALQTIVVRASGIIAERHRLSQLLADPNTYQDGQDFAELMETQYEAAGNVFIRKVRQSNDPARRAEYAMFPVQELDLIRPDYVSIVPGARRELDVFRVTIGGEVRANLPRRDVIHIHEPNLVNDFYGLSKLALLVREGAIDLSMSDFELAFFRNAGVPMGLISVKGKTSESDRQEIKSRFRSAFNGFRHWFDVIVTNSDESTYTPLGIKQSDMEMDSTRAQVESRICSVFGVPPIIVGARVALGTGGGISTYEDAEHSFWAETMVPAALRFGRAFQKHLLPEFAVQADRGATVTYDFTQVRALQEDRSRKLREVVRMVNTGAFTVNQALVTVGMPSIDGGDFYLRNGNQVVVELDGTMTQMGPGGGRNPDNPLVGAAGLQLEQVLRRVDA